MTLTLDDLVQMSRGQLREVMDAGHDLDPADLDDTEYHGVALDIGALEILAWKKFKKVFHRDPQTKQLRGWNVGVAQNSLDAPWEDAVKRGKRSTYWFYEVHPKEAYGHERGVVIDYRPQCRPWETTFFIRDPLVAVNTGGAELLLGYSYLPWAPFALPTTWFALRRGDPLTYFEPDRRRS